MAIERLTIANYDNLENKPIAAKNLATETVEDNNYYLNKAAEKLVYTENPTNPDGSTIDKIYYNMNISVDDVGQSLINMPWDDATVQDVDGIAVRFLQLVGENTVENGGKGVYAIKLTFAESDLRGDMFYISAGYPNFDEEPYHFFIYSADFDATNVDIPQWGWIDFTNELLNPPSPINIPDSFTFNYIANKECWDTWFSTSNEFASSFDFEANTLYKRVGKAYKKIDGNVLEPVDKLPQPTEALKGRVVYNKKDNQIYECEEVVGATTETPISYESLLPLRSEWDSCGASGVGTFFINTDLDSDTVKAIFVGDDSGTLITAQDGCYTASRYVSYQHSGDVLQIIDNTDTCSPRTIFDSSLGGWQESSTAGWMPAEDGKYDYPRYTLNSGTYCDDMSLNSRRSPMGCLFSTSDGGFAGYKIVDGVYFNVHEKFDGSKMFANSSYPVLYSAIADITKQSAYSMMFVNSAVMGEGYEQAGWMILVGNDENYYPIYAENAFDWSGNSDGPQIVVTTAGWQSEYVDLTTGKLKLPANGSISDVGRSMMIITEDAEVTEDLLGNYIGGTPFIKVEGVYKWSNLAASGEETLKLSGNDYKIIQHTSNESLELTDSNSAENVIIVGTIDGTLKIDEGCLETLTYIGYCNHLEVDLSDWINSTNYPKITLIGDGTATIRGNRMAVKTMGGLNVYEISTDNSYPAFFCDIIAGEDVKYSMVSDNSRTVSSQLSQSDNNVQIMRFDCRKLTLDPNDGSSSIYALHRFIDATCERFYIEKGAEFLRNEYNKVTTTDGGCKLLLHMPSYERALVDGCYATNYAGPGSILGDKYLFAEPDTCNSSVYNRSWQTIQDYVDEKTSSGGSGASNPIKRTQFYATSWETSGNGYRCTLGTIDEDPAMVFVTPASNQASSLGVYGAAISEKTISVVSDAEQVLYGTSLLFNVYIIPCPEASYSQAYYIDNNIDLNSHVSYETAYNVAEANRVVCTGGMTEFWDTSSSWNAVYFNKYFPYTFNYDSALSGLELLYIGNSGTQLRLDYNPVDPSAFSLYVYSASASTKTSVYYENGKWLINPDVALYRTYQIPYSMSATAQKAAGQLLSWTGWTYTKKDPKTLINQIESNTSRITALEENAGGGPITQVDNNGWIDTTNQQLYLSDKLIEVKAVVTHEDGSQTQYLTGILKVPSDYIPSGPDNARNSTTLVVNSIKVGTDMMGIAFFGGVDGATYYYRLVQ